MTAELVEAVLKRLDVLKPGAKTHPVEVRRGRLVASSEERRREALPEVWAGLGSCVGWVVYPDEPAQPISSAPELKEKPLLEADLFDASRGVTLVIRLRGTTYRVVTIRREQGAGVIVERSYLTHDHGRRLKYQESWVVEGGQARPGVSRFCGFEEV